MTEERQRQVTVERVRQMREVDEQQIMDMMLEAKDHILNLNDDPTAPENRAVDRIAAMGYLQKAYPGLSGDVVRALAATACEEADKTRKGR